jgi:hypothetical protein
MFDGRDGAQRFCHSQIHFFSKTSSSPFAATLILSPGLNGLARAHSLGLTAFVPQRGTNSFRRLPNGSSRLRAGASSGWKRAVGIRRWLS